MAVKIVPDPIAGGTIVYPALITSGEELEGVARGRHLVLLVSKKYIIFLSDWAIGMSDQELPDESVGLEDQEEQPLPGAEAMHAAEEWTSSKSMEMFALRSALTGVEEEEQAKKGKGGKVGKSKPALRS